jgi:hypothetical protein
MALVRVDEIVVPADVRHERALRDDGQRPHDRARQRPRRRGKRVIVGHGEERAVDLRCLAVRHVEQQRIPRLRQQQEPVLAGELLRRAIEMAVDVDVADGVIPLRRLAHRRGERSDGEGYEDRDQDQELEQSQHERLLR